MKNRAIITAALLLVINISVSAYHLNIFKDGIIKGVVVDSTAGTPLPFANITLHNQKDSSYISGTASGTNGEFIITNVVEGNYYLKVSFLGYSNKFLNGLNISVNDKEYNVGVIKLSHDAIQLQEGQVVGEKAAEELHLDKKVINVGQNLNAAGGNCS